MTNSLSLIEYCIPCRSGCCKVGSLIGSPILSRDEMLKIREVSPVPIKEVSTPSGKTYYVLEEQQGSNRCFFLNENNGCDIQHIKPLDCLCYPIKAVWLDNKIGFIIDPDCPAAKHLSPEFIDEAKGIALKSIRRFDRETYEYWLNNHVGWVKEGVVLEDFIN